MTGDRREEEWSRLDEEAETYRKDVERAKQEFDKNTAKERAILDDAERTDGDALRADIEKMRAALDEAERNFHQQADQAVREFDAAFRKARGLNG